ncbi:MAG: TonB-dependent receptor [Cytophagales bacterium]|nr:TonB-dependent receptor [Cytophagales bacterium]
MKKNVRNSFFRLVKAGQVHWLPRVFLLFYLLSVSIYSYAGMAKINQKPISVKYSNATLKEVFEDLKVRTNFGLLYNEADLSGDMKLSLDKSNVKLGEVLRDVLKDTDLSYKIQKDVIVIYKKKQRAAVMPQKQQTRVSGVVKDGSTDEPIIGASVAIKGTGHGMSTDIDGKFSIKGKLGDILMVSYVGYKSREIVITDLKNMVIVLEQDNEVLDEVVVVAYGEQKKESVLSSMTSIKPEALKTPSSNLTTALAGRMSGIISYQRSGEPGQDNAEFFIRGVTTFGYKKSPLILIDGVELTKEDLARMQPDDIESFSIMKDATATALYGARGANGVILVTTKEGKEGKSKVSVRLENSWSMPTQKVEFADPITYMELYNEAIKTRNPLEPLFYSKKKIEKTKQGADPYLYPAVDWQDMLFKDVTNNQRLNFNVSGGGKVARYYIAGSVSQDNGALKVDERNNFNSNIDLKRYLLRSNTNIDITKTTEAIVRLHATFDDYTGPIDGGSAVYDKVMQANPALFPAYFPGTGENKFVNHTMFGNYGLEAEYVNPYAEMVKGYKDYTRSMMHAQFELKQDFGFLLKGLKARFLGSVNRYSFYDVSRFFNPFYYTASGYDSSTDTYQVYNLNETQGTEYLGYKEGKKDIKSTTYFEAAVDYNNLFNEVHGVSGLLVLTRREQKIANAGDLQKSLPYRNMGLSGRFTYSYDSRYFAEFNFGYNGSERFAANERYGFFPAAGLGWTISNEDFWEPLKNTVSMLKLKATYGVVGNDAIGRAEDRFFYLSNVNLNDKNRAYSFGTNFLEYERGVSISRYANDQITWETAYKANFGIEMELFGEIMFNADLFTENRTNILMNRVGVASMGLQSVVRANVGEASSKGIDMSLDFNHSFSNDFWMSGRLNFTYATNEIKVFEEPDYAAVGMGYLESEGYSVKQKWGLIAERLFADEEEVKNSPKQFGVYGAGDIKYYDVNNDGMITDLDRVPIGYPEVPEINYGFGISTGYKNIDLSLFFQGSARSSFWIDPWATAPFVNYHDPDKTSDGKIHNNALLKVWADNHWSEENPDMYAQWPRLSTNMVENNLRRSTWFMRDGSFLRLKSAEVGYTIPNRVTKRYGLSQFRVYLSGTNLLTFSKFKLWDPEMAGKGLKYPIQRVVNIGVQVGF